MNQCKAKFPGGCRCLKMEGHVNAHVCRLIAEWHTNEDGIICRTKVEPLVGSELIMEPDPDLEEEED